MCRPPAANVIPAQAPGAPPTPWDEGADGSRLDAVPPNELMSRSDFQHQMVNGQLQGRRLFAQDGVEDARFRGLPGWA